MIRPGSIIVMHDQADSSVHEILNDFIEFCFINNYRFDLPVGPGR
jgi:hypothetical protein